MKEPSLPIDGRDETELLKFGYHVADGAMGNARSYCNVSVRPVRPLRMTEEREDNLQPSRAKHASASPSGRHPVPRAFSLDPHEHWRLIDVGVAGGVYEGDSARLQSLGHGGRHVIGHEKSGMIEPFDLMQGCSERHRPESLCHPGGVGSDSTAASDPDERISVVSACVGSGHLDIDGYPQTADAGQDRFE